MKKNVLVVEDDEIIQQVIEWRLNTLGYTVCAKAATAEDAITCAREKKPDVVLMDISLKGHTDGIEAAATIKKMFHLPVVFLTATSREEDLERAKMVNPDGFIVKPFTDTDIRVALKLALAHPDKNLSR
jgi:hypothetical protein